MQFLQRDSVRAFLPAFALALCHGCGGGSDSASIGQNPNSLVASSNRAPTLDGAAEAQANVGFPYEYLPAATDPDNDVLSFSAENLPPWARIDPASGRISGTPQPGDVGAYESISITVADAAHRISSAPFTITVAAAGNGVAELAWQRPLSLDDLAGYRIVYGHDRDDMDQSIFVADPSQLSYRFATLQSGAWYFAVIAVSDSGLEGPATPAMSKTI